MTAMTIEQIAELANISRSTVSRVLNNHPSVRPEVRDRVLQVMDAHGYAPSAAARSLARRRTNVLGLLIPMSASEIFSDPFFPHVIPGVNQTCAERGYFLMLSMVTADLEQGFYHRILRSGHFDGLIILSSDIDDPILPLLIKDKLPLVLVGRHPYFQDVLSVDVENRAGARDVVAHLAGLGHRCIATITGPLQMAAALDRRDGYKQALLEAGLPIVPNFIVEADFTQMGGYSAMSSLLQLPQRPTAVFVASDTMAVGALRAAREHGVSVPDDLAVVGFDDLPFAAFASPPLTTVRQPIGELGAVATSLLIDRLEHPERVGGHVRLPTQLVVRDSSGALVRAAAAGKGG